MEFLKKHYEKVILSVVLLLLAAAAIYLPFRVEAVNRNIEDEIRHGRPKIFEELTTKTNEAALIRSKRKLRVELSNPQHNLFNPVGWFRGKDGQLRKDPFYGRKGPEALVAVKINPLYFLIEYDKFAQEEGNEIKYSFGVTQQASQDKSKRRRRTREVQLGQGSDLFVLKEVKGAPTRPSGFVLHLRGGNREIQLSQASSNDQKLSYSEIAGYTVDLVYPPDKGRKFDAKRRGDRIKIEKKWYEIVVVSANVVVIKDVQTTKQTTIRVNASE